METDLLARRIRGRGEQGTEFLIHVAQNHIVCHQLFIKLSQVFEDGGVGQQGLLHLHESSDNLHAHRYGARTPEQSSRHDCTVLGEDPWKFSNSAMSAGL